MLRKLLNNYSEIATATATEEKNTEKYPRYAAKTENYREDGLKIDKWGSTSPKPRFFGLFLCFRGLADKILEKMESTEQWVAGYGPQVIAWHWPPLAAFVILTAGGPSPEP